jgi:acyl-CoA reductase-like NAD-dependent aldehyde dehydrogenase
MDRNRFADLAAAYGGDLSRWPIAERAGAEAWLTSSPEAARIIAVHQRLDHWLNNYVVEAARPDLQRRIITEAVSRPRGLPSMLAPWRWSMLGAGGALAAGLAAGVLFVVVAAPPAEPSRSAEFGSVYARSSFGDLGVGMDGAPGGGD